MPRAWQPSGSVGYRTAPAVPESAAWQRECPSGYRPGPCPRPSPNTSHWGIHAGNGSGPGARPQKPGCPIGSRTPVPRTPRQCGAGSAGSCTPGPFRPGPWAAARPGKPERCPGPRSRQRRPEPPLWKIQRKRKKRGLTGSRHKPPETSRNGEGGENAEGLAHGQKHPAAEQHAKGQQQGLSRSISPGVT